MQIKIARSKTNAQIAIKRGGTSKKHKRWAEVLKRIFRHRDINQIEHTNKFK